ncbi:MAG: 50S ribosomal protein L15 [Candidatus Pacebacteria bacterium]|jgi:large subunit ribosomal protein L15|nr:50S ribosomal protein L15 [Candidatus Paceibacterota bacterium]
MSLFNKLEKITFKSSKRLGRGYGSGKGGHTVGRGQKGQKSRRGSKIPLWFEGGSLPLTKRLPMWRGKGRFKTLRLVAELTFNDLNAIDLEEISLDTLKLNKIIDPRFKRAKIIKKGKLNRKLTVKGIKVSKAAKKEIETLGGKVE